MPRRWTGAMLIFSTVAMGAAARAEEAPATVRDPIVALTQSLFDAITFGKADVWDKVLADDAVIIDEFGRRQSKGDMVKDIRPLPTGFSGSIEVRTPHVRVHGDSVVIDGEAFEQESVFDQKLVVRYLFLMTFVRAGSDWKLTALTTVTLPTPPPQLTVRDLRPADYPGTYRYGPGRAFTVALTDGKLSFTTKAGGKVIPLEPVAKDVFMDAGDERNLLIFRRGAGGRVDELIERRKFNDLHMKREASGAK